VIALAMIQAYKGLPARTASWESLGEPVLYILGIHPVVWIN
jgi:hypothetical protein